MAWMYISAVDSCNGMCAAIPSTIIGRLAQMDSVASSICYVSAASFVYGVSMERATAPMVEAYQAELQIALDMGYRYYVGGLAWNQSA
jgi:hypothetical protein